ncbi:hypothetical protein F4808DRAFT_421462 [Astrocystis sublimbata]|nr:hypothetical protein F4808DRAFT_421462 [Astrocystis sublimbata]
MGMGDASMIPPPLSNTTTFRSGDTAPAGVERWQSVIMTSRKENEFPVDFNVQEYETRLIRTESLTPETVNAIADLTMVRAHIKMHEKQPVYIISGLRVAKAPVSTKEQDVTRTLDCVHAGGDIILAYQLHMICFVPPEDGSGSCNLDHATKPFILLPANVHYLFEVVYEEFTTETIGPDLLEGLEGLNELQIFYTLNEPDTGDADFILSTFESLAYKLFSAEGKWNTERIELFLASDAVPDSIYIFGFTLARAVLEGKHQVVGWGTSQKLDPRDSRRPR